MEISNKNPEVIQSALSQLEAETGWNLDWAPSEETETEGHLAIERGGARVDLEVFVRSVIQAGQLPQLVRMRDQLPGFLVIAGRISGDMMQQLRNLQINYLDSSGNAFIDLGTLFVLIKGKKGGVALERGHLFTKASVQLLFHLLIQPDLLLRPYRNISKETGASLDNISKTLRSLKEQGYLIARKKSGYQWANAGQLIDRWVAEFGERLKPGLLLGRFRFLSHTRWEELELNTNKTRWGGEPAADLVLNMLHPEEFTLYTEESRGDLIRNYRIAPDPQGNIRVYRVFWKMDNSEKVATVPLLLIYADLLLSGSARNAEVAKALVDAKKEAFFRVV